jgi:hypothetical protein
MARNLRDHAEAMAMMPFVMPGTYGAALWLADVSPRTGTEAFLMRWWPTLMLAGLAVAWCIRRWTRS